MALKKTLPILDEAKQREICAILSVGGTRALAAAYVGCAVDTIRRTAKRDAAFAERLSKVAPSAEIGLLKGVMTAGREPKNWRAATWALERLYPERYAKREANCLSEEELAAAHAEFAEIILAPLTAPQRRRIIESLAEWSAGRIEQAHKRSVGDE